MNVAITLSATAAMWGTLSLEGVLMIEGAIKYHNSIQAPVVTQHPVKPAQQVFSLTTMESVSVLILTAAK